MLEGPITYNEALETLRNMKNNKSPGNTGFSIEFYKFFFIDIGQFLIRSINHGFETNKLSLSQRQGVITCLPKEGKNLQHLNNWRPITILNVSYKIASACISNRIRKVIDQLVHPNQSGFLNNRFIGLNLKLMYDILSYTDSQNIPGMLILVDFYKAFDSIDWGFIEQVLDFLNFGNDLKKWVKLFYTEISSCVSVNGEYSQYFPINRGVRQGDPLSPYLFLLCAEILAQSIRQNEQIKGIKIEDKEALLSQFADDTALYLDGSRNSFEACIRVLSRFASISGLTINFQKTNVIWLGSKKNSNERFLRDMNFTWDPGGHNDSKFRYLGIIFSTNVERIVEYNYENKFEEIENLIKTWNKRFLTPFGKITVIKTLALSKLTYLIMNLPDPNVEFQNKLQNLFYNFLWNGKNNRISKNYVCLSKEEGGLNMVNIPNYITCLKISLFKKIINDEQLITMLYAMYPRLKYLSELGYDYIDVIVNTTNNVSWRDILKHVKKVLTTKKPSSYLEILGEHIFYNKNITINRQTIFFRNWVENGIVKIYQLVKNDGSFLTYQEFVTKYNNVISNFVSYNGVVSSIKEYLRSLNIISENTDDVVQDSIGWQIIRSSKNNIKETLKIHPVKHSSVNKWNLIYPNLNWSKIYFICHKTTIDTKLRWFQLRLLYRILPTNRYLKIRKINNSDLCNLCNNDIENIEHMLYDCPFVMNFWRNISEKFIRKLPHASALNLSKELIIFGCKENVITDKPMNLFLLCAKYYIYSCRFTKSIPNVDVFFKIFNYRYRIEKQYYLNIENNNFDQLWMPYQTLLV